jgi:hypothetical protein
MSLILLANAADCTATLRKSSLILLTPAGACLQEELERELLCAALSMAVSQLLPAVRS